MIVAVGLCIAHCFGKVVEERGGAVIEGVDIFPVTIVARQVSRNYLPRR